MAQFKSYGTPGDFNPFKVPNESINIEKKAKEKIDQLQRQQSLQRETNKIEADLKAQGQKLEMDSAQTSYEFDTNQRSAYRDQMVKNHAKELEALEQKSGVETLNLIKDLSTTAFAGYQAYQEARKKGQQEQYTLAVLETGVTAAEVQEIMKLDQTLSDTELGRNLIVQQLAERGVSLEQIRFLQQTGGSDLYLENKALIQNTVAQFPMAMSNQMNRPMQLSNGNTTTLAEAIENGDTAAYQEISKKLTQEWVSKSQLVSMNPQLVGTLGFPKIHQYWNTLGTAAGAQARKEAIANSKRNRQNQFASAWSTAGLSSVMQLVANTAPGAARATIKKEAIEFFKNLARSEQFNRDHLRQLEKTVICTGPRNTDCGRIEDKWRGQGHLEDIEDAIFKGREQRNRNYIQARNENKVRTQKFIDQMVRRVQENGENITDKEKEAIIQAAKRYGVDPSAIEGLETMEDEITNDQREDLELLELSMRLTPESVLATRNPILIKEFLERAKGQVKVTELGGEFSNNAITNYFLSLAKEPPEVEAQLNRANGSRHTANNKGWDLVRQYKRQFNILVRNGLGEQQAAEDAKRLVTEDFRKKFMGPDSAKMFDKNGNYLDQMDPADLTAAQNRFAIARRISNKILDSFEEHRNNAINVEGALFEDEAEVERITEAYLKNNQWDAKTRYIARQARMHPVDLINHIRTKMYGLNALELPDRFAIIRQTMSPDIQRAIAALNTDNAIATRGLMQAGRENPQNIEPFIPHGTGPVITKAANNYKVPLAAAYALIYIESEGYPNAVSSNGSSYGVGQINKEWHSEFFKNNDWRNPEANADYAMQHYARLIRRYNGDVKAAAMAYNGGELNYDLWVSGQGHKVDPEKLQEMIEHGKKFEEQYAKFRGDLDHFRRERFRNEPIPAGIDIPTQVFTPTEGTWDKRGFWTYKGNEQAYETIGTFLEQFKGTRVGEHTKFGGVSQVHVKNSHHYHNEAFDITHHDGQPFDKLSKHVTIALMDEFRRLGLFREVLGPGDAGHPDHLHLGGLKRMPTREDFSAIARIMQKYIS